MGIERAAHVLVGDAADLVCEQSGLGMKGLESGVLYLVAPQHLLNEQQRIGSNVNGLVPMGTDPLERGDQRPIFGDVIGGHADRVAELVDQGSVRLFDPDAVAGGAGIAAGAAINIRDDGARSDDRHGVGWPTSSGATAGEVGAK